MQNKQKYEFKICQLSQDTCRIHRNEYCDILQSANNWKATEKTNKIKHLTNLFFFFFQMLGSCFLSLLQVQSQFLSSSSDLMSPVGSFQEIGDYLRDREVTLALKDATTAWLSLAQVHL